MDKKNFPPVRRLPGRSCSSSATLIQTKPYLPGRSLVLLYVLCATVAAFVLASLYLQREPAPELLQLEDKSAATVPTARSWIGARTAYSASRSPLFSNGSNEVNAAVSNNTRFHLILDSNITMKAQSNADVTTSNPQTTKSARKKSFINNTWYIYLTTSANVTMPSTTTQRTLTGGSTCSPDVEKDTKLILLWTSFFGNWNYMSQERLDRCQGCSNCRITRDRSLADRADAIVFHARDMTLSHLPSRRAPHQMWAFYCLESPVYSDFPGLRHAAHMFNLTITYRQDSDVVARYGSLTRVYPSRPLDYNHLRSAFFGKSRSVAFLSSHCPTHGGRDDFVAELARHIDVDSYGKCGDRICPMSSEDFCHGDFARDYKFLLAFENAVCKDYVTEKFYRTLAYDIVPVVFGGGPYEGLAPPGSFIDALKFKSPRHLAFFLKGIGEDFDRYVGYFKWRRDYTVDLSNRKECDLCRILHNTKRRRSSYGDLHKWWVNGSQCRTWGP